MEILAPPPTDPLVRKEPPFDWYRTPPTPLVRTPGEDELDFDPDTALWPANVVSRWPFAGAPTHGIFPKGSVGVDSTATMYVCTVGGEPGTWVAVGSGGGGSANSPVVRSFPFAFDTPGILTGAALYTPTVEDILLDAWISIGTAWDGTTPRGDFGMFVGTNFGWAGGAALPYDMMRADTAFSAGYDTIDGQGLAALAAAFGAVQSDMQANGPAFPSGLGVEAGLTTLQGGGVAPGRITAANPIKVCVSQDGTNTGGDPGSTQGAAILYLVTATPAT